MYNEITNNKNEVEGLCVCCDCGKEFIEYEGIYHVHDSDKYICHKCLGGSVEYVRCEFRYCTESDCNDNVIRIDDLSIVYCWNSLLNYYEPMYSCCYAADKCSTTCTIRNCKISNDSLEEYGHKDIVMIQ